MSSKYNFTLFEVLWISKTGYVAILLSVKYISKLEKKIVYFFADNLTALSESY